MAINPAVRVLLAAGSVWGYVACGLCQVTETIELGKRHVDRLHGFSLRLPATSERKREFSAAKLMTWLQRDEKSGAILWSLTVLREVEAKEEFDIEPYSRALADKLRLEENFKIESIKLTPVAGKAAIHLRGETAGLRLWQRQVWVWARPGEFLVLKITGALGIKDRLDLICDRVLGTLELFDPREARKTESKNLTRGEEFLSSLNDKKFAAVVDGEPQWFLLRTKGKDVGFRREAEATVRREGLNGYEVTIHVMLDLPNLERQTLKHTMFVTPDLKAERWTKQLRIGSGDRAQLITEEGLKQQELIVCDVSAAGGTRSRKKQLPAGIYLPQAVGMLLPRLMDLTKPAGYTFAAYNTEGNNFDRRTFTVVGPERISLAGRQIEAIRALDRPAAAEAPATLYLDAQGRLLRMETEDGLVMERSTRSGIVRRFPGAGKIAKAASQDSARRASAKGQSK